MPRTILTTLTAADYRDLQQAYSEKNIINQTNGQEYIISTATKTNLTDIHGASMSKPARVVNSGTPCYKTFDSQEFTYPFHKIDLNVRSEVVYTEGTFSIETNQIITDVDSISIDWDIKYDYYIDRNYEFSYSEIVSDYVSYDVIETSSNKQNSGGYLSTTSTLHTDYSIAWRYAFGKDWREEAICGRPNYAWEGTRRYVRKLANDNYRIDVDYRFVTWSGSNLIRASPVLGIREKECSLYAARQIDFTITANTVEADEVEFNYTRPIALVGGVKGKNYGIESNEFLQTDENISPNQRQSAIVSNEIFDKFDTDRILVSFVLLNCEKYEVGNEVRYLRAEDLIYIKDENGQYLGEDLDATGDITPSVFEVVKTRPIWDGAFSMEVTCRQIDMTT